MSWRDNFRIALGGIAANKLRSALTVLGVLIGVAAVVILVAVGTGSSKAVADQINRLGTNTLTVSSTGRFGGALDDGHAVSHVIADDRGRQADRGQEQRTGRAVGVAGFVDIRDRDVRGCHEHRDRRRFDAVVPDGRGLHDRGRQRDHGAERRRTATE